MLVVPAGKHSNGMAKVQVSAVDFLHAELTSSMSAEFVNDTHEPDLGKNTSVRLFWEQVDCAS